MLALNESSGWYHGGRKVGEAHDGTVKSPDCTASGQGSFELFADDLVGHKDLGSFPAGAGKDPYRVSLFSTSIALVLLFPVT